MPNVKGDASVFRISSISESEIWEIGENIVAKPQNKNILARGDIIASKVLDSDLQIFPDSTPHKLHANITGWPDSKHERMIIAVELAKSAKLKLVPEI